MKPRGIWIAIGLILVTGIGSTRYVRAYTSGLFQNQAVEAAAKSGETVSFSEPVSSKENHLLDKKQDVAAAAAGKDTGLEVSPSETKAEEMMLGAAGKEVNSANDASGKEAEKETGTGEDQEDFLPEGVLEDAKAAEETMEAAEAINAETDKAPGPIAQIREVTYGEEILDEEQSRQEEEKSSLKRLEELDRQMEKKRTTGQDSSANSAKSVAETERKLWENQLNQMVDILKKELTSSEWDDFMKDQNEWIRSREVMALDALSGNSSPAVQELEYTRSLAELTRDRAYELAKEYSEVLKEAE